MGLSMTPDLKQMLDDQRERDRIQLSISLSLEKIAISLEKIEENQTVFINQHDYLFNQFYELQLILSNLLLLTKDKTNKINFLDALSTLQVFTERSY